MNRKRKFRFYKGCLGPKICYVQRVKSRTWEKSCPLMKLNKDILTEIVGDV